MSYNSICPYKWSCSFWEKASPYHQFTSSKVDCLLFTMRTIFFSINSSHLLHLLPSTSSECYSYVHKTLSKFYGVLFTCSIAYFKRFFMLTALNKVFLKANIAHRSLSTSLLLAVLGEILIPAILSSIKISLLVFRRFSGELKLLL